ncbi:MAG TPA: VTT domain-containing protein [Dehalococcoidia bacterium]|nr:VTT domain-containing protein [Dehalococcoidia bacterium]
MRLAADPPPHDPDGLLAQAAETVAARTPTRLDRALLQAAGWLAEHTIIRVFLVGGILLGALIPGVVLLAVPGITDHLSGLGYLGVFVTNLLSTSTVVVPVPGLTATAQALIIREGERSSVPWLVGVLGGIGMGLGEVTLYYAGYLGAELARGRELPGPAWARRSLHRIASGINWLMARWGMATLFVLSAVPNPFFEVAGLTAGSVRMSFRRFFVAAVAGKVLRGILLAYLGHELRII